MGKNIVVCCDGTGNEFEIDQTNVLRLHYALQTNEDQVAFYSPGVGTFSPSMALTRPGQAFSRTLGLAFGAGYRQTIEHAYWFIVQHFVPGDRIYLFGFSRGAYTARIIAALLHGVGILWHGNRHMVPYALNEIEARRNKRIDFERLTRFRKQFSRPLPEKPFIFLGLWDTVSSISWAYDYLRYAYSANNPSVSVVRHAVAIDEYRAFFTQNLFTRRDDQDFKEVWFAGSHSDVGGGYPESHSGLAKITMKWMVMQAFQAGVVFDPDRVQSLLAGSQVEIDGDEIHPSLTWRWWLAELFPKQTFGMRIPRPHLARRRRVLARSSGKREPQRPLIHETAVRRYEDRTQKYRPRNWPREFDVEPEIERRDEINRDAV
ncbi:DUF2235 domain-containing protein [Rhodopirellula sp. MGV]|uniref:DUF2235 domain-containing protein n=1 Tax=Rhodopirellula sp. MGV TaxID=2023130 RepID=UPI000B96117A|nr:DUF2235 domain-containing protein [Rhodopirellula sp. MGV]OYP32940.1 hypothetical protein CGZ80_18735 [Rhodopirellula sp. MGV]PNY35403.1 DUF2235 domain-containing protein [Rhodopirellula baltica]